MTPSTWISAGLTVGSICFLRYLLGVPRDYPLRQWLVTATTLTLVVAGGFTAWRGAGALRHGYASAYRAGARYLATRPAGALAEYVPTFPGTTPLESAASAAEVAPTAAGRWQATTSASVTEVARFYKAPEHHVGWTLEVTAPHGVVLARPATRVGLRGVERLRILVRPAAARRTTRIDYELSRRYGRAPSRSAETAENSEPTAANGRLPARLGLPRPLLGVPVEDGSDGGQ